ncbi:hypothetical protein Bbelb_182730 [Branchiostoma belcheri]|nr:hypothetical protein Bbelb_182730 [Branchiostoma belcheri]
MEAPQTGANRFYTSIKYCSTRGSETLYKGHRCSSLGRSPNQNLFIQKLQAIGPSGSFKGRSGGSGRDCTSADRHVDIASVAKILYARHKNGNVLNTCCPDGPRDVPGSVYAAGRHDLPTRTGGHPAEPARSPRDSQAYKREVHVIVSSTYGAAQVPNFTPSSV